MQGLELLRKRLEGERQALVDTVARGRAKDYADYKYICGMIHSVEQDIGHIKDILRHFEEDDDDI